MKDVAEILKASERGIFFIRRWIVALKSNEWEITQ
jgi:hypothetical protein